MRYANEAIDQLKAEDPRCVLRMGAALANAAKGFREVMGSEGTEGVRFPVASQARREAGFTPAEIQRAADLSETVQRETTEE